MYRISASVILLVFLLSSACAPTAASGRGRGSQRQTADERTDIIERLLPEDSFLSKTKFSALVEAVTTVIKDIDKKTFQHTGGAVREVLNKASLQELRRIERILPEVERRRKLQGVD